MVAVLFMFGVYLNVGAEFCGSLTHKRILAQPATNLKYVDNQQLRGQIIGKTKEVLFLYENKRVIAIPLSAAIKAFEVK